VFNKFLIYCHITSKPSFCCR